MESSTTKKSSNGDDGLRFTPRLTAEHGSLALGKILTLHINIELPWVSLAGTAAGLAVVRAGIFFVHILQHQHPAMLLLAVAVHVIPVPSPPLHLWLGSGGG
ncbi:hypothetical protein E2C01_009962 [Portunus trituberculatus]|uniref:Uncharacterized protein n=1 Tax=Portunus trituberculatus TaxID=210409 RepID=A0A5B7D766_PORTR|nr:hypothetical protein [Portunus trituberculatus]